MTRHNYSSRWLRRNSYTLRNYSLVLNFPSSLTLLSSPPLIKALIFQSYLIYRNPLQLICNQSAEPTFLFFMFSSTDYLHVIFVQFLEHHREEGWEWILTSASSDKTRVCLLLTCEMGVVIKTAQSHGIAWALDMITDWKSCKCQALPLTSSPLWISDLWSLP